MPKDLPSPATGSDPDSPLAAVAALFVASGFAGLVFQVLWMRELALLFGNTAQAAAATLAAFFLGLAAGGALWGRCCRRLANPLRTYAALEAAVAASALLFLALGPLFAQLYRLGYDQLGNWPSLGLAVKLGLSVLLLFPAAFFMGGTLPVLSEHLSRRPGHLSSRIAWLYGANTLGAAAGVLAAGFVLPQALGYEASYRLNVGLVALLALGAWLLGAGQVPPAREQPPSPPGRGAATPLARGQAPGLAAVSGFAMLALEVLWSRMFEQVLQNSVYTFAAVLAVFLGGLGAAALIAGVLARGRLPVSTVLWALLVSGALLTAATPLVFHQITGGLSYLAAGGEWVHYVATVLLSAALVMVPPVLALGTVFPYLIKAQAPDPGDAGALVGRLVAANTLGAIAGALAAGFLLLRGLGLWQSISFIAGLSLAAALWIGVRPPHHHRLVPAATATALLLMLSVLDTGRLPVVRTDPVNKAESLYEVWEGRSGTVAVVRQGASLRIKVNNYYTLGSTGGRGYEERQAHFPLLLHPDPEEVFFLGLGTGITAGAALSHPVKRVEVAELLPEVVTASRRYFGPYLNGLFEDPRVTVIPEDGRHHLAATRRRYDVIVGDLFIPWKAGTAGLYSLEHFRNVRRRLEDGGLFAQWLPLYQLSRREFGIIARTFLEVFPHATLWRGDFLPDGPIVALVGRLGPEPLALEGLARARHLGEVDEDNGGPDGVADPVRRQLLYYAGNLGAAAGLVAEFPLNTDDRPLIELISPRTQRAQHGAQPQWFVGEAFADFLGRLAEHAPPREDPYLAAASADHRRAAEAGLTLFRARLAQQRGQDSRATELLARARRQLAMEPAAHPSVAALQEQLQMLRASYEQALRRLEARLPSEKD